jgi:hypothetical protein
MTNKLHGRMMNRRTLLKLLGLASLAPKLPEPSDMPNVIHFRFERTWPEDIVRIVPAKVAGPQTYQILSGVRVEPDPRPESTFGWKFTHIRVKP